jgi:hypothetical protein
MKKTLGYTDSRKQRAYKSHNVNGGLRKVATIAVVFFTLILQSVSQAGAVTVLHSHSSSVKSQTSNAQRMIEHHAATSTSNESCAHHVSTQTSKPLSTTTAEQSNTASKSPSTSSMDCCGDDCKCSTEHCFNTSGFAIIDPLHQSHIAIIRTTALHQSVGQRVHHTVKQFRPPKSTPTA